MSTERRIANHRAALDAATTLLFHSTYHWRRASERGCSPVKNTGNWHRQTLRMSLGLSATGRWSIAHLCTGRRAYSACDGRHHAPRPLVAVQYGLSGQLYPPGKPGGWSRPDFGPLCYLSLRRPAAHPQR